MLLTERPFQTCVPSERPVLEPTRIKFWRGKKSPGLTRMFPIQIFQSQIRVCGCAFQGSGPVIYAVGIYPARLCRVFLANQKGGNQNSLPSQGTRNRAQPTSDQIESAMAEDRLSQCEIECDFLLRNSIRRIGEEEGRTFDFHQGLSELPSDSLFNQPFIR